MYQTHASCDIVAACAGMPYGLSEAIRLLQEVDRPVLLVCGEKFSDKIGNVRTSRMIFGDGAAAMVIGPAPTGAEPDIEVAPDLRRRPGQRGELDHLAQSRVRQQHHRLRARGAALVGRYLKQMIEELRELAGPGRRGGTLLDSIDLVVPHQANKTMVVELAADAGLPPSSCTSTSRRSATPRPPASRWRSTTRSATA